jgi:hypothetical protein
MKTQIEIDANILGCEKKIQEICENEEKNSSYFLSIAGKTAKENGRKTIEYINGWICALKRVKMNNISSPEFKIGYKKGNE